MAGAGLLSLMVTWWASPIQRAAPLLGPRNAETIVNRFSPLLFDARGIVPAGYAVFAFALGVTAGVLIRRTVAAMAATLAVFAGAQFVWPQWIRSHLLTPVTSSVALNPGAINGLMMNGSHATVFTDTNLPGAWVLSTQTLAPSGQVFNGPAPSACRTGSFPACQAALARLHLRQLVTYQPASRYWAFQWYETAVFLALALVLAGFCFWWIRRRRIA